MAENQAKINVEKIDVKKMTGLVKGNLMADPISLFVIKLPEYDTPVQIKEEYIDELIFKLQRLKSV
jgi:hypothetical protein